ncbi:MAG TPA: hypothetical protein ENJ01_00650 [Gammaproteobacteria bacterium]|nr:hypothetical protein [Gammaproteobacteria bacterium]
MHICRGAPYILFFLMLIWVVPVRSLAYDAAANGPLATVELDFPDLRDAAREGRRVPIKVHVPQGDGPYPVIIISHGAGGNRDTHFAQARHLASHGYVVLAVEHTASNTARLKRGFRKAKNLREMARDPKAILGRPKDVGFAIDRAEAWQASHPRLGGRLDLGRIGVLGHSYGAYTSLTVAGARPALDWLEPAVPPGRGLGPDLHDPRVRCAVALSPQGPGEPFFHEDSYASLRIPVMGISGTRDRELAGNRPAKQRLEAFRLWPTQRGRNRFVWIDGARHVDFGDATGSGQRMLPSRTRKAVQPVVRAATLLYFDGLLKEDLAAWAQLSAAGLQPYLRDPVKWVKVFRR